MCFLEFISREVEEDAGLLESQCTFFGGILNEKSCCWVVIFLVVTVWKSVRG